MKLARIAGLVALMAAMSSPAWSATVKLTGGDTTDGLSLTGTQIGAIHWSYTSQPHVPLTWQGYTFASYQVSQLNTFVNNIRITAGQDFQPSSSPGVNPTTAGFTNPGSPSAEDTNLVNLVNNGLIYRASNAGPLTVTIQGLVAGNSYNVNFLSALGGYPVRSLNLAFNGGSAELISMPSNIGIYATSNVVTADLNGQITAVWTAGTPSTEGPFFNSVIVTAVPEPSTYALIALGGVVLMVMRRRMQNA